MNTSGEILLEEFNAPLGQDKYARTGVQPSVPDPVHSGQMVRTTKKAQKILEAGRVDVDTDAIIQDRLRQGRKRNKHLSKGQVVAAMLTESAQRDAMERAQAILVPIIQDTIRAEFQTFTNRFLGLFARVVYQVGFLCKAFLLFLGVYFRLDEPGLHKIEDAADTAARVGVIHKSKQIADVEQKLRKTLLEDKA